MVRLSSFDYQKIVGKYAEAITEVQGFGSGYLGRGDRYVILDRTPGGRNSFSRAMRDAALSLGLKPEILLLGKKGPYGSFDSFPREVRDTIINKKPKAGAGFFCYEKNNELMRKEHPARLELINEKIKMTETSWLHSPGITLDMALNGAIQCDYKEMKGKAEIILDLLRGASEIHIKAPGRTSISVEIPEGLLFDSDCNAVPPDVYGKPGKMANLPVGEVYLSRDNYVRKLDRKTVKNQIKYYPVKLIANGLVFADVCAAGGELDLHDPPVIEFRDGEVKDFHSKNPKHKEISQYWDDCEKRFGLPSVVYKVGIGLNDAARITGNILEDEKSDSTANIGIGNVNCNQNFVFIYPTIEVEYGDGTSRLIMKSGRLNPEL